MLQLCKGHFIKRRAVLVYTSCLSDAQLYFSDVIWTEVRGSNSVDAWELSAILGNCEQHKRKWWRCWCWKQTVSFTCVDSYMNLSRWCPTVANRVQQRIDLLMHHSCITVLIKVGLVIHSFNNADIYFFIIWKLFPEISAKINLATMNGNR